MGSTTILCECRDLCAEGFKSTGCSVGSPATDPQITMSQAMGSIVRSSFRMGPQIDKMLAPSVLARSWPKTLSCYSTAAAQKVDANLPQLPVPPLQSTLEKLIKTSKPHLSPSELSNTLNVVQEFGKPGGIGEKLQKLLERRASTSRNWLEDWWINYSYMGFRSPVVVHSSPGLVFPLQNFKNESERLLYAARVVVGALKYKHLIDQGQLPQDRQGSNPLDMAQYSRVFGVCRIPSIPLDKLRFPDKNRPPTHIVVVHNNNYFKVPVLTERGEILDEEQILFTLKHVVDNSTTPGVPVGILSSADRDSWSKAYEELSSLNNGANKKSIEEIESSLFLLCLDKKNPKLPKTVNRRSVAALQMLHGLGSSSNGSNRWFEKTIQFIVGVDGEVGLCYEHSPAEGQPIASMMDFILKHIASCKNGHISDVKSPRAEPLPFSINNSIQNAIADASQKLDSLIADVDMNAYSFQGYGKDFPKQHKMSPDSFIQMAMQLAFYRIHKVPGATYETASTRMFLGGRTETIRSCSEESTAFCKAMLDSSTGIDAKFNSLKLAVNTHRAYTTEASKGLGVDRHLLGLKLIAQDAGIEAPALYSDPGYTRSSRMRISSSQVASSVEAVMCYGPLVPDGYACCYNPLPKQILFAICAMNSCPETSAQGYVDALEKSLLDMQNVVLACSSLQPKL